MWAWTTPTTMRSTLLAKTTNSSTSAGSDLRALVRSLAGASDHRCSSQWTRPRGELQTSPACTDGVVERSSHGFKPNRISTTFDDSCRKRDELPRRPLSPRSLSRSVQALDAAPTPSSWRLANSESLPSAAGPVPEDRRVRVALGLHPLRADTAGPLEEGQLIRLAASSRVRRRGRARLLKAWPDTKSSQLRVFDRLLAEPVLRNRVVTVHSRERRESPSSASLKPVVTATPLVYRSPALIESALAAGLYFSVNPAMFRTEKGRPPLLQSRASEC